MNFKILYPIVMLNAVDVMHNFCGEKRAAKMLFHDDSMLLSILAVICDYDVAVMELTGPPVMDLCVTFCVKGNSCPLPRVVHPTHQETSLGLVTAWNNTFPPARFSHSYSPQFHGQSVGLILHQVRVFSTTAFHLL